MAYGTKEIKTLLDKRFPGEKFKRIYKQQDLEDPNKTIRTLESSNRIVCVISDFTGPTSVTAIELASPRKCASFWKKLKAEKEPDDLWIDGDRGVRIQNLNDDCLIYNSDEMKIQDPECGIEKLVLENFYPVEYKDGRLVAVGCGDWQTEHTFELRISADDKMYYIPGSLKQVGSEYHDIVLTDAMLGLNGFPMPTPTPLKKEYVFQVRSDVNGNQVEGYACICEKKYFDTHKHLYDQENTNKNLLSCIENFDPNIVQEQESIWGLGEAFFELIGLTTAQEKLDYIEEFRQYLLAAGMTEVTF